ncbi:MAG: citrate synthase [Proteobacteria bacterium]|nr:citrate synthase [Pseudomonadota bacterium]
MKKTAKLIIDEETFELPIVDGSEGDQAIDIRGLRKSTGYIAYDPGLGNTGTCRSTITFMDGEKGSIRYRGIPIEQLAEHSTFVETAMLLINGKLPTMEELNRVKVLLTEHSMLHEDMQIFFQNFPRASHPMGILSSMVTALQSFYPGLRKTDEALDRVFLRLISKVRTMAAMSYKISQGHKVIYPRSDFSYCENFLNMMFNSPVRPYTIDPDMVKALNTLWILQADHEQNCSTSAVRIVGSGNVNIYAAISAGVCALWGPLHGGANRGVIEMLSDIEKNGGKVEPAIARAKDKNDPYRLMGFGHRVYKIYDPRAKIMKAMCDKVLSKRNITDPLLEIAQRLEEVTQKDEYFLEHNLYPNLDLYSSVFLRAVGIPTNMFSVMFAIGRLPGWISQWKESMHDSHWKLCRPRQIYIGSKKMDYVPVEKRK